jgi:hypothetical protein
METNMGTLITSEERTFTIEEYYKLAEIGILQPWERVELIDGHRRCSSRRKGSKSTLQRVS